MTALGTRSTDTPESVEFGVLTVAFDDQVLRPRAWTALQAEWAAEVAEVLPPGPILELCSGAGHIGLLAAVLSGRRLVQVDSDPSACRFAQVNAGMAGLGNEVEVRCADLASALGVSERFPLIIADPPYISTSHVGRFPDDPPRAIDGGPDGLDVIRGCVDVASKHLADEGRCLLQIRGLSQLPALGSLAKAHALRVRDARVFDDERAVALLGREDDGA